MCGICGVIEKPTSELNGHVLAMTSAISHRGPDDSGTWTEESSGAALGHRRLSIVDLSPLGHQPMASPSGRYVIVFNGEVYNFQTLRTELEQKGYSFRGGSDTEVMLAAFEAWGIEQSTKRFIGMFAFGVWDREASTLTIGRDRLGIKPLFYSWNAGAFLFSSELKSFRAHPNFRTAIDRDAVSLFLRYGYIPAPLSIYEGVYKLTPGCLLTLRREELENKPGGFSPEGAEGYPSPQLRPYWTVRDTVLTGKQRLFDGTEAEAIDRLDTLLGESVKLRMIADVPLGAFLSGGIDSSVVVALMQKQHSSPVKTFTIGFDVKDYNEAEHAAAVAKHLGTDHTELYVSESDLLGAVPELSYFYDEPFADSSEIPTMLVSRLARKEVTVALSGDGGDEIFGGYNRYTWPPSVWRKLRMLPAPLRSAIGSAAMSIPIHWWERLLPSFLTSVDKPHERMQKLLGVIGAKDIDSLYSLLLAPWNTPHGLVPGARNGTDLFSGKPRFTAIKEFAERAMYLDQQVYLPDDNLQKVDRASMAVALEVRVPILDHRVVEFSAKLPLSYKIRGHRTKWILREVLKRYVPDEIIERPKMGFSVPVGEWLRGPLRSWAGDLLNPSSLQAQGYIRPDPVRHLWDEHLRGVHNWQHQLWNVLMFQSWLERWKP